LRTLHAEIGVVDLEHQTTIEEFDSQVSALKSMHNEPLVSKELHIDQAELVAQSLVQVPPDTFDILIEVANQVDSSIVFELVVLQERIKLLENQNSSLAQTNVVYCQ